VGKDSSPLALAIARFVRGLLSLISREDFSFESNPRFPLFKCNPLGRLGRCWQKTEYLAFAQPPQAIALASDYLTNGM
jgi:hypothetical protein